MRAFKLLFFISILMLGTGLFFALMVYYDATKSLPNHRVLRDYRPDMVTRIHTGDGRLLAEYAAEKRVFVPIEEIPENLLNAFLSAEDKNFYNHSGIDFTGIIRAIFINVANIGTNRRLVGASTITQQVAKNFLLTSEVSFERKLKEAILAFRIEKLLTKKEILELYLNEIYLGMDSYGVPVAAQNYFNKSLNELTLPEIAYLASLPKAPNNYHPIRKKKAAVQRRDWVIKRMAEEGHITMDNAQKAIATPLEVSLRYRPDMVEANYFVEEVRRKSVAQFGKKAIYRGGLSIRTTLDSKLQHFADQALRNGLISYDRRHGFRGPVTKLDLATSEQTWQELLKDVEKPRGLRDWQLAVVLGLDDRAASIGLNKNIKGEIPFAEMRWARKPLPKQKRGPRIKRPGDALSVGDVVIVSEVKKSKKGTYYPPNTFKLEQIPEAEGALIAMDPHTGRILAMTGGYDFSKSEFNRAVQAKRQPGSSVKPFVYMTALENGYTPASTILDAPIVLDQGDDKPAWRPDNYSQRFYGESPLRIGIEHSRNLMTIRLAQKLGMKKITKYIERFGIAKDLPRVLSVSIGAGETTLLDMVTAYSMIVNGGKRVTPSLVDQIQDSDGQTLFKHDNRPCPDCQDTEFTGQRMPEIPDLRQQIADPIAAYQMTSMLEGAVKRGTGRRARVWKKFVAGKTGTTNNEVDAWFLGFSPDLVVGVFVGFDSPRTLGRKETGGSVAAPIFGEFMKNALKDTPAIPFRVPQDVNFVRLNRLSGKLTTPNDKDGIMEAFRAGTEPTETQLNSKESLEGVEIIEEGLY